MDTAAEQAVARDSSAGGDAAEAVPDPLPRVAAYLRRIGMQDGGAIRRVCGWLNRQVDPAVADPALRTEAALRHFDQWMHELPAAVGAGVDQSRVGVAVLSQFGPMLECLAESLDEERSAADLAEHLQRCVERWPRGILPVCAELEMPRQPLGDLPAVLRGEFWSGTYRWVTPAARDRRRAAAEEAAP